MTNAPAADPAARPPLRLYRGGMGGAEWERLVRAAAGRVAELGRAMPEYDARRGDPLALARLARSVLRAAARDGNWQSVGDALMLVQAAVGLMEADAAALAGGLADALDAMHDLYRGQLKALVRERAKAAGPTRRK